VHEPKLKGKSHDIPKQLVWDAWLEVKEKGGAAGADGVTIEQFEEDLKGNGGFLRSMQQWVLLRPCPFRWAVRGPPGDPLSQARSVPLKHGQAAHGARPPRRPHSSAMRSEGL
jgi:hypothetical protein